MESPDFFLADLPAEAAPNPALLAEACQTLRRNAAQYLAPLTTERIIAILDRLGREWRSSGGGFRKRLLLEGPGATGFSERTLEDGLDAFFAQLTARNLERLILRELGDLHRLDRFSSDDPDRAAFARGPRLVAHFSESRVPIPVLTHMVLGLLARSAQFVKCAPGRSWIPRLIGHSIHESEPKLAACIEIAEWKDGSPLLDAALRQETDCAMVEGDETLAAFRAGAPRHVRVAGSGARLSFGFIAREAWAANPPASIANLAARDVAAWDQSGSLAPHVFYVETGGPTEAEKFAELLADELRELETTHPRGPLHANAAAAIARRRSFYEVRAADSPGTLIFSSEASTAWTVVFEEDLQFQASCGHRFIYVKPAPSVEEMLRAVEPERERISTLGLAATALRASALAHQFAQWGVPRVCPLGRMQYPPLAWREDGRPALGELIGWSHWEKEP